MSVPGGVDQSLPPGIVVGVVLGFVLGVAGGSQKDLSRSIPKTVKTYASPNVEVLGIWVMQNDRGRGLLGVEHEFFGEVDSDLFGVEEVHEHGLVL